MTETVPDPTPQEPGEEEQGPLCPSVYPHDQSITCELLAGHSTRMLHRRQTAGPDSPYYEWE
ncbi:hypothetical protein AB9Q10_16360 [Streptomyces krungchingensis]|uniref:hypothetical protein n=1 Tax=Streptomyces krungchingensis TaxID=1565034 RepID=UPI003CECA02B